MWTVHFWKATAERVVATFAVALISAIGVGAQILDVRQIQWGQAFGIAGGAALLTLLKCLVAGTGAIGPKGSPGLVADPAAANQPAPRVPTAADRLDLEERLVEGNVRKVGGYPGGILPPPSTRASGSPWPREGSAPPD